MRGRGGGDFSGEKLLPDIREGLRIKSGVIRLRLHTFHRGWLFFHRLTFLTFIVDVAVVLDADEGPALLALDPLLLQVLIFFVNLLDPDPTKKCHTIVRSCFCETLFPYVRSNFGSTVT